VALAVSEPVSWEVGVAIAEGDKDGHEVATLCAGLDALQSESSPSGEQAAEKRRLAKRGTALVNFFNEQPLTDSNPGRVVSRSSGEGEGLEGAPGIEEEEESWADDGDIRRPNLEIASDGIEGEGDEEPPPIVDVESDHDFDAEAEFDSENSL
jgi:hypothetical protein